MKNRKFFKWITLISAPILVLLIVFVCPYRITTHTYDEEFGILFNRYSYLYDIGNYDYDSGEVSIIECPKGCSVGGGAENNKWLYFINYGPGNVYIWNKSGVMRRLGIGANVSDYIAPVENTNQLIWATHKKSWDFTSTIVIKQSCFFSDQILYEMKPDERPRLGTNVRYKNQLFFGIRNLNNEKEQLVVFDLEKQVLTTLLSVEKITKPSISPNGEMILYSAPDGVYLLILNSMKHRKIIDIQDYDGSVIQTSWSKDSEKFVYDHYESSEIYEVGDCSKSDIYVYNLDSGKSELIISGGCRPFWIGN